MRKKSVKIFICDVCNKNISSDDTYVLLGTYNSNNRGNEESFYHIKCFSEWFDKKVYDKVKLFYSNNNITELITNPLVKDMVSGIVGRLVNSVGTVSFDNEKDNKNVSEKGK